MPAQAPFAVPASYSTELPLLEEMQFRQWVRKNNVPFNVRAEGPQDYDMRGYWRALQAGQPTARAPEVNQYDNRLHFTDYFKTPLHESFAGPGGPYTGGSQWADANAPQWINDHQLADAGRIVHDDNARSRIAQLLAGQ